MLSTTANIPLITYWGASYCPPCRTIKPLLQELLQQGDKKGWNLQYVEAEVDAPQPGLSELALRYQVRHVDRCQHSWIHFPWHIPCKCVRLRGLTAGQIRSLPTLLPFFRGEPCDNQKLTDTSIMTDRQQLTAWLEHVSTSRGRSGSSYSFLMSLFGG